MLANGSLTGTAEITNNVSTVNVTINTTGDFAFGFVHAYLGSDHTCLTAREQLGFEADMGGKIQTYSLTLAHGGGDAYMAIHLE